MKKIAIIGGIGSGKSVVSKILRTMGYPVYDCDSNAKRLMATCGTISDYLISEFGQNVFSSDGSINRGFLAEKIFNDSQALSRLNSVVHPIVKADFAEWVSQQMSNDLVFVETAILFESGMDASVDMIWNVEAPVEVRIQRVVLRNNTTPDAVKARIESQSKQYPRSSIEIKNIDNGGDAALLPQIDRLLKEALRNRI